MRVDLIFPPMQGADALAPTLSNGEHLGLAYLASSLRAHNHKVRIINSEVDKISAADIVSSIVSSHPDLVGFSPVSASMQNTIEIIDAVKKRAPKIMVVLGGHLATLAASEIITHLSAVDVVLQGDAEQSLVALADGQDLPEIPGAHWRDEQNVPRKSLLKVLPSDLDALATPARDDLDKLLGSSPVKSARILASRGCQYDCSFCTTPTFYGRIPRFRNPNDVVREMRELRELRNIDHFWFNDDLFVTGTSRNTLWIEDFCELLRQAMLGVTFRVLCRADSFRESNKHTIELLRSAGLTHVFLGLESGSEDALRVFNKRVTVKQNLLAIEMLRKAKVKTQIGFIMFNPYSSLEDVRQNANFLAQIGELFRFFPLTRSMEVFFGTPIYHRLLGDGLVAGVGFDVSTVKPTYLCPQTKKLADVMNYAYERYSQLDHALLKHYRGTGADLDSIRLSISETKLNSINLERFLGLCEVVIEGGEQECRRVVDSWMKALAGELAEILRD